MSKPKRKTKRKAAACVGVAAKPAVAPSEDAAMTTKARVVKYRTHRGVYTAVVKDGSKWLTYCTIDDFPIKLYREPIKPVNGRSEAYYMDNYDEYPLVKAVKTMLFVGSIRGINENAKKFLEDILVELKVDVKTIKPEDMV